MAVSNRAPFEEPLLRGGALTETWHEFFARLVAALNAAGESLDAEASASAAHRSELDIHRRAEDIDHGELLNSGVLYTHAQIENHIDDLFLHNQYPALTTFTYDGSGNLTGISNSLGTKTYTYSGGDLVGITGTGIYKNVTYTYNGSGDLTQKGIS